MNTGNDTERESRAAKHVEVRASTLSGLFRDLPPSAAGHAQAHISDIAATHPALLRLGEILSSPDAAIAPIDFSESNPARLSALVSRLANRLTNQLLLHDRDALLRAGKEAALSALSSFAGQDGVSFETHAYSVVWARLQVLLRQELEIVTLVRERMNTATLEFVKALAVPTVSGGACEDAGNLLDDELGGLVAATLVALVGAVETLQKDFPQLDRATVGAETAALVHSAMAALTLNEHLFLEQRYWFLRSFEDIAASLDIAPSDARVVHHDVLVRVGRRLRRRRP